MADNIRAYRSLRRMSQATLAGEMSFLLPYEWSRATVSEIERGGRSVSVEELFDVAVVLGVTLGDLLDPAGPERRGGSGIDVGGPFGDPEGLLPLPGTMARLFVHGHSTVTLDRPRDGDPLGSYARSEFRSEPSPEPDGYLRGALEAQRFRTEHPIEETPESALWGESIAARPDTRTPTKKATRAKKATTTRRKK